MQRLQQSSGIHMQRLTDLMTECIARTKVIYTDLRAIRHTIEYQRVRVGMFLPFNSKKSVIGTFRVKRKLKTIIMPLLIVLINFINRMMPDTTTGWQPFRSLSVTTSTLPGLSKMLSPSCLSWQTTTSAPFSSGARRIQGTRDQGWTMRLLSPFPKNSDHSSRMNEGDRRPITMPRSLNCLQKVDQLSSIHNYGCAPSERPFSCQWARLSTKQLR